MSGCDQFNVGYDCGWEQSNCGCKQVIASTPVWQSQFYDVRVCGLPGGSPFLNVTRPNADGICPDDTTACIEDAPPNDKVCYPPDQHESSCPITDI